MKQLSVALLQFLVVCVCACVCVDIDECSEDGAACGPLGTCQNSPGGFRCSCPRGYEPDSSGTSCEDLDECGDEQTCQYGCINLPGGYRCECPIGFIQHIYWNQCIGQLAALTFTHQGAAAVPYSALCGLKEVLSVKHT